MSILPYSLHPPWHHVLAAQTLLPNSAKKPMSVLECTVGFSSYRALPPLTNPAAYTVRSP